MFKLTLLLPFLFGFGFGGSNDFVQQHIDTISIVHTEYGNEYIFFFDFVQNEWSILDHRWLNSEVVPTQFEDKFSIFFYDYEDSCYRLISCDHWYESWVKESPLAEQNNRPWFARLLACGLKKPPKDKEK